MDGIPPNVPGNPFSPLEDFVPGSIGPVGISDADWDASVEDYFFDHPAFERINYNTQGQPADGSFHKIWDEVRKVQRLLTQVPPTGSDMADQTRYMLRDVVLKSSNTSYIQRAVCLGLGRIKWRSKVDYNKLWVQQCGLFLAVCQLLEEKQHMAPGSLPKVFQEPQFEIEDRWILEKIGHQRIVKHPAANAEMGRESFVYAPHFGAQWTFETFFVRGCEPGLLYANTMHGSLNSLSGPIVNKYFDKVYWTGNPNLNAEANDMFETVERFLNNRDGTVYNGAYSTNAAVRKAFADSSFYWLKG